MASAHLLVAQLALVVTVVGAIWTVGLALTRRSAGSMVYGLLLWVIVAIGAAGLIGVVTALTIAPPSDPLHVLYGLLAAGALPLTALIARDRPPRHRATVLATGMVVLTVLVVRLFQTGG